MKLLKTTAAIALLINSCFVQAQDINRINQTLDSLFIRCDFFRMQRMLDVYGDETDGISRKYYTVLADNVFNRCEKSAAGIEDMLSRYKKILADSQKVNLYSAQLFNYLKLYNYEKAAQIVSDVLAGKAGILDSNERDSYQNMQYITQMLAGVAPQTIKKAGNVRIKTKRDKAGLITLPVGVNKSRKKPHYIFDTGANISVMTESEAKKHSLRMLEGESIDVKGGAGNSMMSKLGVADSIKIGTVSVYNVVFIVLPDEALTFRFFLFNYKIKGIIGYPVMQQLGEVQLTRKHLFIPEKTTYLPHANLALKGYMPIINMGVGERDTCSFIFDSGAKGSNLFKRYFMLHEREIYRNGKVKTIRVAGAGHSGKKEVYELKKKVLKTAGVSAMLDKIYVYTTEAGGMYEGVYGLLGQDFIRKFKKTTINFEYMYIGFE